MRRYLLAAAVLTALAIPEKPAQAQGDPDAPPGVIGGPLQVDPAASPRSIDPARAEAAQARLEDVRARLDLTDEQSAQMEPILRASLERRAALLQEVRASGSRPSLREMRGLRSQLDAIDQDAKAQLEPILSPAQMAELEAIQDELRAEARERFRETRAAQ